MTVAQLSSLLLQTVTEPGDGERPATDALASQMHISSSQIQLELLHARAFAVDLALETGLGDSSTQLQLKERYTASLQNADEEAWELLHERLQTYHAFAEQADASTGLTGAIGGCFAALFEPGPLTPDLAHLGGRLFSALFDEISELLVQVEIVETDSD